MAFPQSPAPELLLADDAELQPGADDVSSSEPGASIPGEHPAGIDRTFIIACLLDQH